MLGRALVRELADRHDVVPLRRQDLDITKPREVLNTLRQAQPDWVLHTAAFTQVDLAESRPEEAFLVNAWGTRNVAAAAGEAGAAVLYYSTDYVFDGKRRRAYSEWDVASPLNVYGESKLAGENEVRSLCSRHLIIRTSWLFGPGGRHFVRTILTRAQQGSALRVINDQRGSPTYTLDLAVASKELIELGARGICNVTNSGSCTWFELACAVLRLAGLEAEVTPVESSDFETAAVRPAYSVLDRQCLLAYGIGPLRSWEEAVKVLLESEHV